MSIRMLGKCVSIRMLRERCVHQDSGRKCVSIRMLGKCVSIRMLRGRCVHQDAGGSVCPSGC